MKRVSVNAEPMSYSMREEMNTLRTNIQFSGIEKKVIIITSCISGEGKSLITFNLAKSMAELGKKVLLIDADMRKSSMVGMLGEGTVDSGLSHYLSGQCSLADVVYRTNVSGMHIMFAGVIPPNPTELLDSSLFENTLDSLREIYDYVFVDSAPLGMVVDAAIIAKYCDGSILLVEANVVKYRHAQVVKEKLVATGCPFLGVILNKVDRGKSGKDYGYYKKYYGSKYEGYGDKQEENV